MFIGSKTILREKNPADAWDDYAWETDPELAALDASQALSISYSRYLSDYTYELHHPTATSHRFAIDTLDGKHIGNCGYYNLDKTRGETEVGIMIGNRDYWNKGYGTDAVTTLVNYIFRQMNLNRIYLKTLDWNSRAQRSFQKCGFTPYGRLTKDGHNFVLMEIYRSQWQKQQNKAIKLREQIP